MEGSVQVLLARLDERLQGYKVAFDQLVHDNRSLTDSFQELSENMHRISALESDVSTLKASEKKRSDDQEKARKAWVFEVLKTGLAACLALILFHFGVK